MKRDLPPGVTDGREPGETLSYGRSWSPEDRPDPGVDSALARGASVHRYTILDRVGEGGMGVVYAAYDPSLDRRVALKFMAPREPGREGVREMRLLREAQAMARLSHPNVAVVYEVGTFQGHVFLAMEFVDGVDLRTWLSAAPRSRAQILAVFRAAGRGLAAAHAAGIVHRDFKPANVLLDDQDRARVTDFGLSRSSHVAEPAEAEERAGAITTPSHLSTPLTLAGRVVGTPSYMAPEQHHGLEAGPAADQFAFCVALHEALHGVRPFSGATAPEIAEAIAARRVAASAADVPRWLRAVVMRGLKPEPRDRWPSMDALLEALGREPGSARRRWLLGGAMAAGLVAVAPVWLARSRGEACPPARDRVAAIWDAPARQRVRAAFLATGASRAADVFGRAERALDGRLSSWVAAHHEACAATRVRGEQSEATLDLRMQCLERARRQIAALPELWLKDVKLDEAVRAALTVGELDACSDAEALRAPIPPPREPQARQKLEALELELDRVATLQRAGQLETGLTEARRAAEKARQLEYAPVLAEALHRHGQLEVDFGKRDVGMGLLHEAFRAANEAHDDTRAATVARLLLFYSVYTDKRLADADVLWKMAEAAAVRVPANQDLQAELLSTQGTVLSEQGKRVEAAERLRRAVALKEKLHPGDDFALANQLNNLGAVLADLSRTNEAISINDRARAAWENALGSEHPLVAVSLQNLALLQGEMGDFAAAIRSAERGLAVRSKIFAPDHPEIAVGLQNLAGVEMDAGRDDEARMLFERAARIREEALGADHPALAVTRNHLADLAVRRGDTATARRLIDQVLPVKIKTYGEHHQTVGHALETLGAILLKEKNPAAARAAYEKDLAIQMEGGGDGWGAAFAMSGLGEVALSERKPVQAIALFERARQVLQKRPQTIGRFLLVPVLTALGRAHLAAGHRSDAAAILEEAMALSDANGEFGRASGGRARFQLARAVWASGQRARAADLARAAQGVLGGQPDVGEIDRWLERHPAR